MVGVDTSGIVRNEIYVVMMQIICTLTGNVQYARALKEKGVEVKVIVFPSDVHAIERPQSDFESSLNIGVWFKKYCK